MFGLTIIGNVRGSQLEMIKRTSEEHRESSCEENHKFGIGPISRAESLFFFLPMNT